MQFKVKKSARAVLRSVDETVEQVEDRVGSFIMPVRRTVFERFPVLFTLLVTFGAVATLKGFDLLVARLPAYMQQPLVLLTIGVTILILTGTLYKKLG